MASLAFCFTSSAINIASTAAATQAALMVALGHLMSGALHPKQRQQSGQQTLSAKQGFSTQASSPASVQAPQHTALRRGMLRALTGSAAACGSPAAGAIAAYAWSQRRTCVYSHYCMSKVSDTRDQSPLDLVQAVAAAAQRQDQDAYVLLPLARLAMRYAASGNLSAEQIRDLCVSFAELGFFDNRFNAAMAEVIPPMMPSMPPSLVADIMYAYGVAEHRDAKLLAAAVLYLKAHANVFDADGIAKMLWSFSHCGFKDDALLEVVDDMAHNLAFTMQGRFDQHLVPLVALLQDSRVISALREEEFGPLVDAFRVLGVLGSGITCSAPEKVHMVEPGSPPLLTYGLRGSCFNRY